MTDPLAGSAWSAPDTVAGFARSAPNPVLMDFARHELHRVGRGRVLDVGCGAGRNAVPLAEMGWNVVGLDLSWPMLRKARERATELAGSAHVRLALAPMDRLPIRDRTADLVIAHGIWNLARTSAEFRRAVGEAARAARPGAALFVFTFSRNTLRPDEVPVQGESFVFTGFSGEPQCFLTQDELVGELRAAGFEIEPGTTISEYNRRQPEAIRTGTPPVIYEGVFRRTS